MKIVINQRYGGFGISVEAYYWLKAHDWAHMDKLSLHEFGGRTVAHCEQFPRHDPMFVRCVEELDDRANGEHAGLCVVEAGSVYRITEYDGYERVECLDGEGITADEVEQRIAAAIAAERAAILAEVERLRDGCDSQGNSANVALRNLTAWLDARSKGGAK